MQWIAMLTMLIDHIGVIFFPDDMTLRMIGRIAFPIYAYALVQGHLHTSNRMQYVSRLFYIALLSQIPYQLALNPKGLNVVVTLFMAAGVLNILDRCSSKVLSGGIILLSCIVMDILPFDYGAYGLLLVVLFRYLSGYTLVAGHFVLNFIYLFYLGWLLQILSILPTMIFVYGPQLWSKLESLRVRKWVWRSFYPLHLIILAIVKLL
ncbi:TraX family protein [Paenibacillus sp. IHBB 10380]|uniref:TraX family protein n=1 Tax=Paenibacillus sp. IHBB 10380 TaxID=1566358 RepID=UPI0005CFCA43|nr:TraX family protein [Paenibacillus sp. IHBB 10380]AJS57382.1 conjugal transfer protein TraX [Paenibacillus sp. IHBB 10380]